MLPKRLLAGGACCVALSASAQQAASDSANFQTRLAAATAAYYQAAGSNLLLYKGAEYTSIYPNTIGTPFFGSDSLQQGTVSYDGILYPGQLLKYDLVNDELLLQAPQNLLIRLASEKVDSFVIGAHHFVKQPVDSVHEKSVFRFYERLYTGALTVWQHQQKRPARSGRPEDPDRFAQYDTYYIESENGVQPITDEKTLLRRFGAQQSAVKKYLRGEGLRFKKAPGPTAVKAVAYYEGLKK